MLSIKNESSYELIIKKSKFIGRLFKVNNVNDVKNILEELKIKYKDFSHICYAYIINNAIKYSDDKEPSGTAGMQILNILQNNNLNFVLGIVIRYFGGTKLGTGLLSRSYFNCINETLKKALVEEIKDEIIIILETNINNLKLLNNLVKDYTCINKVFDEKITYSIKIDKDDLKEFISSFDKTNITYKIK